jgi:hypothetical protein
MRKHGILGVTGGAAALLVAGVAAQWVAASEGRPAPDPATTPGVWGLLEELVRTPAHLREQRAGRMAEALRGGRSPTPTRALEIPTPPMVWEMPEFELVDAESSPGSAVPAADGLEDLLETYRTLSPAMKARLRGMRDADMVRAVERLARAERELAGALGSK